MEGGGVGVASPQAHHPLPHLLKRTTLSLLPSLTPTPIYPFDPTHSSWIPKDRVTPAACIFLAHGVNEHVGRYNDVAHSLTRQGYAGKERCRRGRREL